MKAMKNAVHLGVLAIWGTLGVVFTLKCILGATGFFMAVSPVLGFWLWFAGFAAVTSFVVSKFESPLAAAATHALAYLGLQMVPQVFPLNLLRLGLDLLK
jgi:hypothetical protein